MKVRKTHVFWPFTLNSFALASNGAHMRSADHFQERTHTRQLLGNVAVPSILSASLDIISLAIFSSPASRPGRIVLLGHVLKARRWAVSKSTFLIQNHSIHKNRKTHCSQCRQSGVVRKERTANRDWGWFTLASTQVIFRRQLGKVVFLYHILFFMYIHWWRMQLVYYIHCHWTGHSGVVAEYYHYHYACIYSRLFQGDAKIPILVKSLSGFEFAFCLWYYYVQEKQHIYNADDGILQLSWLDENTIVYLTKRIVLWFTIPNVLQTIETLVTSNTKSIIASSECPDIVFAMSKWRVQTCSSSMDAAHWHFDWIGRMDFPALGFALDYYKQRIMESHNIVFFQTKNNNKSLSIFIKCLRNEPENTFHWKMVVTMANGLQKI
jgi:hypothetical protein